MSGLSSFGGDDPKSCFSYFINEEDVMRVYGGPNSGRILSRASSRVVTCSRDCARPSRAVPRPPYGCSFSSYPIPSNSNSYCGDSDHAEENPSTYGSASPEKFSIRKRRGLCENFFQRIEKGLSPEARQENAARPPTPCRPLRAPCPACETKHLPQGSARGSTNCSANVSPPNVGQMIAKI